MRIRVLHKGDKVIGATSEVIVIERKNGEVDIIPLIKDESSVWIDTERITTIGYGDNVVEVETKDGITITNF